MRKKSPRTSAKATTNVRYVHVGNHRWTVIVTSIMGSIIIKDHQGRQRCVSRNPQHMAAVLCNTLDQLDACRAAEKAVRDRRLAEATVQSLPFATFESFRGSFKWVIYERGLPARALAFAKTVEGLRRSARAWCNRNHKPLCFVWENDGQVESIQPNKRSNGE